MNIQILTFGSLTDIIPNDIRMEASDTDALMNFLGQAYPGLGQRNIIIAVNNTIIQENTPLQHQDIVALMPPYAGG